MTTPTTLQTEFTPQQLLASHDFAGPLVAAGARCRADEAPHVGYLETALTEMRDRTWIGESGRRYPGTRIIGLIWERALAESLGPRRRQNLRWALEQVEAALGGHPRRAAILEQFHALGSELPTPDENADRDEKPDREETTGAAA